MYDFLKDKTVLYIEDELDVLKNISTLLRNFFSAFYIASDGESGYKIFQERKIDVLLVDIELPKMNGIELIKKVRKKNKNIPIVIISAYTKTDYLLESVELNLDKYIVKPLTSKKIHQLLTKLNNDFTDHDTQELAPQLFFKKSSATLVFGETKNKLTVKELKFLSKISHKKVITYEEIYSLWGDDIQPSQNAVRSFIKQLRKKLPENFLKNNNSIGYFIENSH